MDSQRRSLQVGAVVLLCALAFRLLSNGIVSDITQALHRPEVASVILFLGTGRIVRLPEPQSPTAPVEEFTPAVTDPVTTVPATEPQAQMVFSPSDASLVQINSFSSYEPDVEAFLQQPLQWDLTGSAPTVLILHTHGTESYVQTDTYRTTDTDYNMVSIGDRLVQLLEAGGISVIHDRTAYDEISYNASYSYAREAIHRYLEQYPSICMVLDIHRDAIEDTHGNQQAYRINVDGQQTAQLMMVVGTDESGQLHPNWRENMALAVKLHAGLEKRCPGICRPISFRTQRFNQDLSTGAMLIEVGAAGNTHQEALLAAEHLAQGILDLAHGTRNNLV